MMVVAALAAAALVLLLVPPGSRRSRRPMPLWRPPRPGAAAAVRRAELEWVEALAAETRAGRDPVAALVAATSSVEHPALVPAVAAAASGADAAAALRATRSASELVLGVAACWEVAQGSGAGLAASLSALADSARESERVRRDLRAGVAEPRATALVLAALPVLGLLLGGALGADPWSWLMGTTAGRLALVAGVALEVLGGLWSWRIVQSLERDL